MGARSVSSLFTSRHRYGDISPITTPGRVVVLASMGAVLVTASIVSSKLVSMLFSKSSFARASYRSTSAAHVIVCGALGGLKGAGRLAAGVAVPWHWQCVPTAMCPTGAQNLTLTLSSPARLHSSR